MLSTSNSEIKGTFQESPVAELLAEISQAKLSGSLRLAHQEEKAIIYLTNGEVVFAVSNLRQHRLFEILLQNNQITKEKLRDIPEFTNDMAFAQTLISENIFSKLLIDEIFKFQTKEIIKTTLTWQSGGWSFNHLARAKENLQFQIDISPILLSYARNLSEDKIIKRFKSFEERFYLKDDHSLSLNLLPHEGYIYSRLTRTPTKVQEIKQASGISDADTLKTLYILWIGNFICRKNWNSAISEKRLEQMLTAKVTLKKEVVKISPNIKVKTDVSEAEIQNNEPVLEIPPEQDEQELLKTYLDRVENAESYYEILDVPIKANLVQIKNMYFQLAKKYHPDKFHQEADSVLQQRVQNAFTEIARAYETLKDESAREVYNFKLRKYLESVEGKAKAAQDKQTSVTNIDRAREEFEIGFEHLMNEEFEEAAPFLVRAVQLAPENARYHAYLGKVLSYSENQRFKAESEIRAAMKLDNSNPSYWIMLAEFYLQFNLLKRAEGELQRLLIQFPENKEALSLLDSLQNK